MLDSIDKYLTEGLSRVNVPIEFRPHIIPVYPPDNHLIFEEWFRENYMGCNTDRQYLDIFPTSYWVNHNYGNDISARAKIQSYVSSLPMSKKYFSICQYDDGFMIDWEGRDVLEFNMSKQNGVMIPLLCQPHPYEFNGGKKWFANFIGSKTHPIRESVNLLNGKEGYYISYESHNIEMYCKLLYESMFTLCFRGYGINSFRCAEAIQYGSIPVMISDKFVIPWGIDFEDFGVLIEQSDVAIIDELLQAIPIEEVVRKQNKLKEVYERYFIYESNLKLIIKHLENEYGGS